MSLPPASDGAVLFWKMDRTAFCPAGQSEAGAGVEPPGPADPPELAPPH